MKETKEDQLKRAVADVVELAAQIYGRDVDGIEVDFQASGEYPYRVRTEAETLPIVGVARSVS